MAPVIIATDKTQLTQFSGNKSAYPVYLTLGNIPKALRRKPGSRACVLIAYLSVDKPVKAGLSKTTLKLRNYQLFHRSMAVVLESLKAAGNPKGPGVEMVGGDGAVRRVYPLLSCYVADYPEQCLVTCTKYGTCPKCQQKAENLHLATPGEPRTQRWTRKKIDDAQKAADKGGAGVHARTMKEDIAGGNFEPFWAGFPLTDIHRCLAPDVLHQLYQGILKHLVGWVQHVIGEEELDECIRKLPPTPGVRHFAKGIAGLAQVTGTERKHIARILLACLVGKMDPKGITACRAILHFIQLAQYPSHDQDTLRYMEQELDTWHKFRDYFIMKEARDHFNIPKFHSLLHYVDSIRWLGTTDNYNTEAFERLHIDLSKEGWRASNKRDHFPQMTMFISRQEKISSYDFYRTWGQESDLENDKVPVGEKKEEEEEHLTAQFRKLSDSQTPIQSNTVQIKISKHPQERNKKLSSISVLHNAPGFVDALKLFLSNYLPQGQRRSKAKALEGTLPFITLPVWHGFGLTPSRILEDPEKALVKAKPFSRTILASRFDTVLVLTEDNAESTAVQGMIFSLEIFKIWYLK